MLLSEFDYDLPPELIAQEPLSERDKSKLLVLHRDTGEIEHRRFYEIGDYLYKGDLLVLNNTQVTALRLKGWKATGGKVEVLLLRNLGGNLWDSLVRPGRRVQVGTVIEFGDGLSATVVERTEGGGRILDFGDTVDAEKKIRQLGEVPLPPYIHSALKDVSQYQTVYASQPGSAAAPTAGFHFTTRLLEDLRAKGIQTVFITLHVGIGTFRPVRTEFVDEHVMHKETISISEEAASIINSAEGRIIAVGTTTVRALESAAVGKRRVAAIDGETSLFITPGYEFKVVEAMVTNFHMPKSTLLILVSAFAGRDLIMRSYEEAKKHGYRFLSFGDAMFII
jgi:S-adenosylmethionine:tRNA ribosyltransferase-isomerase